VCTRCQNIFDEGIDLLKGCPHCGWKKFQFVKNPQMQPAEVRKPVLGKSATGKFSPKWPTQFDDTVITKAMGVRTPPIKKTEASPEERETPSKAVPIKRGNNTEVDKVASIKIPEPGTYELNLSTLFERDGLVMAVKEGTYLIDLATAFRKPKKD
jgi:predicted  nucleic acid-binding Zn-ribbon protein